MTFCCFGGLGIAMQCGAKIGRVAAVSCIDLERRPGRVRCSQAEAAEDSALAAVSSPRDNVAEISGDTMPADQLGSYHALPTSEKNMDEHVLRYTHQAVKLSHVIWEVTYDCFLAVTSRPSHTRTLRRRTATLPSWTWRTRRRSTRRPSRAASSSE